MKKKHLSSRLLSWLLVVAMLCGFVVPVNAASAGSASVSFEKVDNGSVSASLLKDQAENLASTPDYANTDVVRVSIVLEKESTLEAGFSTAGIADNAAAMSYRAGLAAEQASVTRKIEKTTGEKLDVVWNLTLAANIISANVEYGQIEAIEQLPEVAGVLIETRYEPDVVNEDLPDDPNMATSSAQIGSAQAWAAGYTGAGSRIAVIDTGIDTDHQSFTAEGFNYSLAHLAGLAGKSVEEYTEDLNLLDAEETAKVWDKLNASTRGSYTADQTYISTKIPYGFNYVDKNLNVTHDNDTQGEHGSHVEGIAAANAYIPNADGTFSSALNTVMVQGVAPDAQIIVMKVFGAGGGAYDSDYMAAIEDAIVLGADSVNLSLGSGNPGRSRNSDATYQAIMDNLAECGTVVAMSAGNSGSWVENANNLGYLYADDVSMQTNGSPGSYTNSLSVASVDNDGATGEYLVVGDTNVFFTQTSGYSNLPMSTIAGEHEYIFIDGMGTAEDFAAVGEELAGKIAVCSRGEISFYQKGDNAAAAGAIATIIYNNQPGTINMDLSDYSHTEPCVSVTQAEGALLKSNATAVTDDAGNVLYYKGALTVSEGMGCAVYGSEYYTMSSFSSWGVPGSLELKPEITTPGGNIYSINGSHKDSASGPILGGSDQYESMSGTSMASPQVAGMAALVAQYIRENNLESKTGLSTRQLAQSLLMSTAVPMLEEESENYYSVLRQGAGLGNVGAATSADSYILMGEDATASASDGKVKVELGDDPARKGEYKFSFSINNLTGQEQAYALSADFFTQDLFNYYVNNDGDTGLYMDTLTASLAANVTWTVDGKEIEPSDKVDGLDFNGDGYVNAEDGQALLDYATGVIDALSNAGKADLDGDGEIDSHDAYLFFNWLGSGTAVVPANGSVNVTVTVALTASQKKVLDTYYTSGAYIEGYVFADGMTDEEGVAGTTHSIPVLGFYGNWTDASMFDVGTRAEYETGSEVRIPYLGNPNANTFAVTYADDPGSKYYFGGNPLIPDDTYMPERNAINSVNGDQISQINFIAIRNAAASRFMAVNKTTGALMASATPGAVDSAYYYTNGGTWRNTGYSLNTKFTPKGAAEGDLLEVALTLVPEYYVDAEGNVDWDALGKGASLSTTMVVDNTAPELHDVSISLTSNTMNVIASDNQYVAAVALFNAAGTKVLSAAGAVQNGIDPGDMAMYSMSLDDVNGKKFLLQVFDYAMNTTTYAIEMQIGEEQPLPGMMAFDLDDNQWITFTKESTYKDLEPYAPSDLTFFAASIVDHLVFASTDAGDLYVMPEEDLTDLTLVGNMGDVLTDMAYNKADGQLYGVTDGYLVTVDKLTGELNVVDEIGIVTNTLACDANGTFYCNEYGSGKIYSFTLDTIAEPVLVVQTANNNSQYVQTMEIDPNTGLLCWNSYYAFSFWGITLGYSYYYEIDTQAGTYTRYNDLYDELSCLIIPEKTSGGGWSAPTDQVSGMQISDEAITLLKGNSKTLTATVQPWTATDRSVTWSSDDESVATVDNKGVVTGVGAGTATVTAVSVLDPTFTVSCTVTVETLSTTLKGALQDEDGNSMLFTWDLEHDETWTGGAALDFPIDSVTLDPENDVLYLVDAVAESWNMHKINPATGETIATGGNAAGVPLWDMEYSQVFSTADTPKVASIYYYYFLAPKDPMNLDTSAFNLQSRLSSAGASYLVAATSLGYETIDYNDETYETEHFILLDNAGNVWNWWTYAVDDSYSAILSRYTSNLAEEFPGYEEDMYTSLIVGEDGALYLSAFNGDTNNLYYITIDDENGYCEATLVGDVGDSVWPAALYAAESNTEAGNDGAAARTVVNAEMVSAELLSAEELNAAKDAVAASINTMNRTANITAEAKAQKAAQSETVVNGTAEPMSDTAVGKNEKTVTLTVTAKDAKGADVASNNGLMTVEYDASALTLKDVVVSGDYTAQKTADGAVTFGYVSLDGIAAGKAVATLTFEVKDTSADAITVTHKQVNDDKSNYKETVAIDYTHENTEVRGAKEATCTEPGYTGDTYCTDCGALVQKGEVVPAAGHSFGEWTVTKEATCTEDGVETRTCANCGETETRVISATGHDFGEWTVTKEATCTEEGEETRTCANCGETETRTLPMTDHAWGEWMQTKAPTCEEAGMVTRYCADCGKRETGTVEPLGHNYTETVVAPTCTEEGYTLHTCSNCGDKYKTDVVEALGHDWGEWSVATPADCFHAGSETRSCSRCEATEVRVISANSDNCPSKAFTDVDTSKWYHEGIDFVVSEELMNGVGKGLFQPNGTLTRAQMVTVLYRLAGTPETNGKSPFTDVAEGRFYTEAVAWAAENGIVKGVTATLFAPDVPVTREQLVTFMARYAQKNGVELTDKGELSAYPDASGVSSYAVEAMTWAVGNGIVNGKDGKLMPKATATRAEIATILMRYCEKFAD